MRIASVSSQNDGKAHLITQKGVYDSIRLLLASIEHERNAHREATNDFFVLGLMRIRQHFVQAPCRRRAKHDETHSVPTGFARNSGVAVQRSSQVFVRT